MNNHSTGWLPLSADTLQFSLKEGRYTVSPSITDIPVGVRADYDPSSQILSVKLKYLFDAREPIHELVSGRLSFKIGKSSGNLMEFTVVLHGHNKGELRDDASSALIEVADQLARSILMRGERITDHGRTKVRLTSIVTKQVLTQNKKELASVVD